MEEKFLKLKSIKDKKKEVPLENKKRDLLKNKEKKRSNLVCSIKITRETLFIFLF